MGLTIVQRDCAACDKYYAIDLVFCGYGVNSVSVYRYMRIAPKEFLLNLFNC